MTDGDFPGRTSLLPAVILLLLVLMDQATTGIYRPRRPEWTDLHLAVRENHGLCPHYLREYYLQLFGEKGKPGE